MYGTNEEPLFDARQILIDSFEYKKLNENWFYKNNKNDSRFVIKLGK